MTLALRHGLKYGPPPASRVDPILYAWRALHGTACPLAAVDSRSVAVTAYREKQRQKRMRPA